MFVEVRTKSNENHGTPEDTINYRKKQKLVKNAEAYIAIENYKGMARIDAICIILTFDCLQRITHYENII